VEIDVDLSLRLMVIDCRCWSTLLVKDELNAFSLGINLQRGIESFSTLGGHALHLHSLTFHKVFILCIGKRVCQNSFSAKDSYHFVKNYRYQYFNIYEGVKLLI